MSTADSRGAELIELAREFIRRVDDQELELEEAVDWALGDDFKGRLRQIIAEHDYQAPEPKGVTAPSLHGAERYRQGYRAGSTDRYLGARSGYAEAPELGAYAAGYHDGVLGLNNANPETEEN